MERKTSEVLPRRIGVRVNIESPALVLEYNKGSQLRRCEVHLTTRDLQQETKSLAASIMSKHGEYFQTDKISNTQVESLLQQLQSQLRSCTSHLSGGTRWAARSSQPGREGRDGLECGDLNRASDLELQRAKDVMGVEFESNRVMRGDAGYVYDKRVDFAAVEASDWDDDDENNF